MIPNKDDHLNRINKRTLCIETFVLKKIVTSVICLRHLTSHISSAELCLHSLHIFFAQTKGWRFCSLRSRMQRFREGIHIRTMKAKRKVEEISKEDVQAFLKKNAFVLFTVGAVIVGIVLGFALRPYKMTFREVKYFSFPGELLMRMLQMLVLPLLISSLITGMAALDSKASGKMGMRAVIYYMTTTFIAVFIGILVVLVIHPGKGSKEEFGKQQTIEQVSPADAFLDLIRNMFPPNLVQACTQQFKTKYGKRVVHVTVTVNDTFFNSTNGTQEVMEITREERIPVPGQVNGVNALGLVVFSMCFGLIIGNMKEQGQLLRDFFDSLNEAIMRLVAIIMCSATLPVTFKCLEENNKIDKRITRFILPVGATINMDGTALYEALAAIFIAQVNNMEMNFGQIITISITATAASIGAAGIPQAGLVTMVIVLTSVGLPTDDITLIIAVDWFLDRLRTTTNVLGDSIGAGIVEFLSRHELRSKDVEMGNSVLEEKERKKPYKLISQDSDVENDKRAHTESHM
uniref:Amino acid transporter n=1 Tax=Labrus bergylta TaxID=56723 RepID=A0A3Q3N168_9LABR